MHPGRSVGMFEAGYKYLLGSNEWQSGGGGYSHTLGMVGRFHGNDPIF